MLVTRQVRLSGWPFALVVLALTLVPLAELALLIAVGKSIGLLPTLLLCAATGFIGSWIARAEGLRTLRRAQAALAEGRFPGEEILDGAFLLAGGVLLLTPGFLTDFLGLFCLLPPTRLLLRRLLRRWWDRQQGIIEVKAR